MHIDTLFGMSSGSCLMILRLSFHPSFYSSQSLISHLCFQVVTLNAPFFPTFELPASQIFILLFTGLRDRGVKKEGRDLDLSIKDEQHLKCIKRDDEHTCSGMARCKLRLNA